MSQSLFRLPSLRQSVCRELQRLLHSRASRGKTSSNPARPHPLCSFCYLQHQRLLSTEQAPVHRAKAVNAADSLNDENRPPSGLTGEVDSVRSSAWQQPDAWMSEFQGPAPQLNWDYLCNPDNRDFIRDNIANRKGVGDIDRVCYLWKQHQSAQAESEKQSLWQELVCEGLNIPNISHPDSPIGDESKARTVEVHSERREFDFQPKTVVELGEQLQMLRTDNVALATGPRTYYFLGNLAHLEQALIRFTLAKLKQKGFQLVSVPDLLHPHVIESCGFKTHGERTQVYRLMENHGAVCLAGTSEMSLGGLFMNEVLDFKDLPKKVTAVSRCYRAETSDIAEEKGIYRVHQFTKVEMFGVTADEGSDESGQLLQDLVNIERELFTSLALHFRVLDMPTEELGAPAHRKFDIETWMPGRGFWGEISSASNCTDFQSRRLNIRYRDEAGNIKFAHTVNGTACAVPRMVMALLENNQQQDGRVVLPGALEPWMGAASSVLAPPRHKDPFVRIHDRRR